MKLFHNNFNGILVIIFSLFLSMGLISCGNEDSDAKEDARQKIEQQTQQNQNNQMNQPEANGQMNNTANQSSGETVYHYTCPNGCEGTGSNSQGKCSNCGTALTHNNAYHQQMQQQQMQQQQNIQTQQQNATPLAKQNGEFHYICSAGCDAGAAQQGTCPECGAQLSHNPAYHQ